MGGLGVLVRRDSFAMLKQRGLNMVDLMIWVIIGALIASFAIQSIQQYRTAAIVYQMKTDLKGAADLALARGVLTGFVSEDEVSYSVENSMKSAGVSMSWGKFTLKDDHPGEVTDDPLAETPQALGERFTMERVSTTNNLSLELASVVAPSEVTAVDVQVDKTFVLVARHDEAPDIRVVYFFDQIFVYKEGAQEFPVTALPPVQDMPTVVDPPKTEAPEPAPPTPTPTPEPEPSSTPEPVEPSPTPTPEHTHEEEDDEEDTVITAPVGQPAPTSSPTPTPAPSPGATTPPEDLTPEPNPLTPGDNLNPKTKKFLFCHHGMMHSNSYTGMIKGHQGHPEDIMPPIPFLNYPGWNWNYKNAQTFYNNCVPVTK